MEDKDLELFIPIGHRLKIFKKIKDIKKLYEMFLDTPNTEKEEISHNDNLEEEKFKIMKKSNKHHKSKKNQNTINLEEGTQVQSDLFPLNVIKTCCWNCLILIDKNSEVVSNLINNKQFCCSKCLNEFLDKHYVSY